MFVQPEQIRAARALLDWSQQDLADASNIAKDTVKNVEAANSKPNIQTMSNLVSALEVAGIEFLSDGGLRPVKERIRTLEGQEGLKHLMDLLYKAWQNNSKSDIIVTNVQEALFTKWLGDYTSYHRQRMNNLFDGVFIKIILAKGNDVIFPSNYLSYRWIKKEFFGSVSLYSFHNHVALLDLSENKCLVHILENQLLSDTFLKLLSLMWENADDNS